MSTSYTKRMAAGLLLAGGLFAQDAAPVAGGFTNQGSATVGFRLTDVSGYKPKYQELVNLNGGLRLMDFDLFGKAAGVNRYADSYSATFSGLGGEPFSTGQLTVRKNRVYDLRVNLRQSHYYWNQNDSVALANRLNGLTGNHDWATVRKLGSVNLLVHATDNLRFSFEYFRNTRDGVAGTTRSLDYFGAPTTWAAFARANPYYVVAPLAETSHRTTVGVDYTLHDWTLHYRAGYQTSDQAVQGSNPISPERSLNIDDASTAKELVNGISWSETRRLHTPVSEFSYTGGLGPRLKLRGGYIFYRYRGPGAIDASFNGTARTTSTAVTAPYSVSFSTRANVTEPNHVIDQGLSYQVKPWWDFTTDYRYTRFTVNSDAQFRSVNGATVALGQADTQWRIGTSALDLNMVFTPTASLLVRAGVRLMKNDVVSIVDNVTDASRTKRIKTVWPIGSIYFHPTHSFSVRADVEQVTNGTSYTRVSPHTDIGGRLVVHYSPTERLYFDDTAVVRNRTLLASDYRSTIRSNAFTVNYDLSEHYTGFAGFSYDSLFASNYVSFLRGTAPFTNLALRDQTISRVWQGGLKAEPFKNFGITFSGNFVRVTGVGEIAGEAPLYGPMSFPYATGSVFYGVPRVGRFTLQLQRTYYTEEIVPGNNFGANLLTIAMTRSF
ncbi:MAG: hypothetical protein ABI811_03080 [Acidobacteriota bacterium]